MADCIGLHETLEWNDINTVIVTCIKRQGNGKTSCSITGQFDPFISFENTTGKQGTSLNVT